MFKRAESAAAKGALVALMVIAPTVNAPAQVAPPAKPATGVPAKPVAPGAPAAAGTKPVVPAAPGTATRPAGVDAAKQKKNLDALVLQGIDAMVAEDHKAARDAFLDALTIDPRNGRTLEALGTTYMKLDDVPRARGFLERAASSGLPMTRSLAINSAAMLMRSKNAMRAAKFVRDFIAANPNAPPDEDALNAMATALSKADDNSRLNKFFSESIAFYESYNAKLEATRPGQRRWGAQWMGAKEANKKLEKYKRESDALSKLGAEMSAAKGRFSQLEADYAKAKARARTGGGAVDHNRYQSGMRDANADYARSKEQYDEVNATFERPPFLPDIKPIAMALDAFPQPTAVAVGPTAPPPPAGVAKPPAAVKPPVPGPVASAGTPATPGAVDFGDLTRQPVPPPVSVTPEAPVAAAPPAAPARRRGVTKQAAAFPVSAELVVTTAEAVAGATRISLQAGDGLPFDATVVASDEASGLALLKAPGQRLMPLTLAPSFAGGNLSGVGFPSVNIFDPVPETLAGGASAAKPEGKWTVRLARNPRLGGGPLLSADGKVVGVQLATRDADAASVPAATLDELRKLLADHLPAGAAPGTPNALAVTMQLTAMR